VEDDHVDRPGVEVRQRMKLTGTNRSIGLIVLIICAHRGLAMVGKPGACPGTKDNSFSFFACVSPTWWLWRSGCTRSHSELGRETLQR
jgi:hypothetical protein